MTPDKVLEGIAEVIKANAVFMEALLKEVGDIYGSGGRREKIVVSVEKLNTSVEEMTKAYTQILQNFKVKDGKLDLRLIRPDSISEEDSDGD